MTRFKFSGDQGSEHCGYAAASTVISNLLLREGSIVKEGEDYDSLVVNGDDGMHHGSRIFHEKMQNIESAQREGKQTYLINSVWQENPGCYDEILRKLDGLTLKGLPSQRDLALRHRIGATAFIDWSFFAPIDDDAPFIDLEGAIAITDVLVEGFGFAWLTGPQYDSWKRVDLHSMSWSSLVKTLRTAQLLVTGRHHAVYAACRARIPFVPIRDASHQFADLLETARAHIPVCATRDEVQNMAIWAVRNKPRYNHLFDWMEAQPSPQSLAECAPKPGQPVQAFPATYSPNSLAIMANARSDHLTAGVFWEKAAEISQDRIKMLVNAGSSYFRGGNIELGAELFFKARGLAPDRPEPMQNIQFYFPLAKNWIQPETPLIWRDSWARAAETAVSAADRNRDNEFTELAAVALAHAAQIGPEVVAAARLFIAARLVDVYRQDLAWQWWNGCPKTGIPNWMETEDKFWVAKWAGRFSEPEKTHLSLLSDIPSWGAASYLRAGEAEYLWTAEGVTPALAEQVFRDTREFPQDADLFALALKIAIAAGDTEMAKSLVWSNQTTAIAIGQKSAPVADFMTQQGFALPELSSLAALAKQVRESELKMKDRLSDRTIRVAVVGNSPAGIGSGDGRRIDQYDEVVRFNHFKLDGHFERDYGSRTNIVCAVSHSLALRGLYGHLPVGTTIGLVTDKRYYQEQHWPILKALMDKGYDICFPMTAERAELTTKLKKFASTGLTFCLYLKKLRGVLDRRDFYGFSFSSNDDSDRYNYYSNSKGSEAHDWTSERRLFDALFDDAT